MAHKIIMPRQGQSVESCIISKWHKNVGDQVAVGDMLFSYETDKAAFDEESKVSGVMLAIVANEGDDVPCLDDVCIIGESGEDISALLSASQDSAETTPAAAEAAPVAAAVAPPVAATSVAANVTGNAASPRAKRLAAQTGVDIASTPGTGPRGRVIERDVIGAQSSVAVEVTSQAVEIPAPSTAVQQSAQDIEVVKNSVMRKAIARAMSTSLSTMAQLTLNSSFDATEIMSYRAKIKASMEKLELPNITLNDIVLYAVSRAMAKHPTINAWFDDENTTLHRRVHLGVAVDTPRGLVVPTIFDAHAKTLSQISDETKSLAKAANDNKLLPDQMSGGTFTVTNLGVYGIESFTPVINPPQVAILGVCGITQKIKQTKDGYANYPSMGLSLTFDHRAVDGAPAARFLKDLCVSLENFSVLLCK